jgi:hypothetical protein
MSITTCYRTTNGTICQTLEDAETQDAAERLAGACSGVPGNNAAVLARCLSHLLRQGLIAEVESDPTQEASTD